MLTTYAEEVYWTKALCPQLTLLTFYGVLESISVLYNNKEVFSNFL